MINGKRYDWEDIQILLPQGVAIGITEISYSDGQAIAARYGKGAVPRGYGRQNYEASGSMGIDIEDWKQLVGALAIGADGGIYDHELFSIVVMYANSGTSAITDKLSDVKITSVATSNSQGSENAGNKTIEFTILKPISYDGVSAKKSSH